VDSRIDPAGLFGLAPGDAQILRNAGGEATDDVIDSVRLTQENFGVGDVMVVQPVVASRWTTRLIRGARWHGRSPRFPGRPD
jgi:hypothetical protein